MKNILISILLLAFGVIPGSISAEETLHPAGFNILSSYDLSSSSFDISETLIITRTIQNNEFFSISGLYLSENIPSAFEIVDYELTINGASISAQIDSTANIIYGGNDIYYWIIDNPDGSIQNSLNPGDNLTFTLTLSTSVAGEYTIPFHTSSFFGNSSGFFSTDNSAITVIASASDTVPPATIIDLTGTD